MAYDLYPAVDETYNFPPEIRQSLARSLELRNDVEPMTTAIRNNLLAAELWDGRTIANTTTDRLERYDAGTLTWATISETADLLPLQKSLSVQTGFRNVVRNGNMQIAQRGNGPFTTIEYTVDGWVPVFVGGTLSVSRVPQGVLGSPLLNLAISGQSLATHYANYLTVVEDVTTLAGKQVTVSFTAKAASGTPKMGLEAEQYFGTGGSPSAVVSTPVGTPITLSTTLTRYTFTFTLPPITGKTLGTNGDTYIGLYFWVSAGANFATRGSGIGIQNNTFSITDVQCEEGTLATPFEFLPIQQQLDWCQRYFWRTSRNTFGIGQAFASNYAHALVALPQTMRVSPTVTYKNPTQMGFYNISGNRQMLTSAPGAATISPDLYVVSAGGGISGLQGAQATIFDTPNPTTAYIDFSAEL